MSGRVAEWQSGKEDGDLSTLNSQPSTLNSPLVQLDALDVLWFQVSGTLCNLTCAHCFISCSPQNDSFGYLRLETVERMLEESVRQGVKEFYFTGGEPFLNREMVPILVKTLEYGPATVLTNGTVLKDEWLETLRNADAASRYSLELRVSIDGPTAEINDPIRGARTFERAMRGVAKLVEHGFLPIITMTRTWEDHEDPQILGAFRKVLAAQGYTRARLKILPRLKIGAEQERSCGYTEHERVTPAMLADYDQSQLICSHSRIVTDKGVYVCPILIESPDAKLGETLDDALTPYPLRHGACYTCYQYGAICSNVGSRE